MMSDCLLYLISPPQIIDLKTFQEQCLQVIEAGAASQKIGAFQLRLKTPNSAGERLTDFAAPSDEIRKVADALLPIFQDAGICFILNDDAALAAEIGADGVHLGQEDSNIKNARELLGDEAAIGVTCHASRHLAMEAGEAGADYVAFGAFYPTTSKSEVALQHWGVPTTEIISWWTEVSEVPCVAIGGITPQNAKPLIEAGADFIAVISSVWNHPISPQAAMIEFVNIL
jgi:thiamine-phosphate pyrophosphorylase